MLEKESPLRLNDIRLRNTLSILRALIGQDSISRIELSRITGFDNTAVTRAIQDLTSRGLVESAGKKESGHGRPREMLVLSGKGAKLIGISMKPDSLFATLSDLRGRPRFQSERSFNTEITREVYLSALDEIVSRLIQEAGGKLAGIGVSTFGTLTGNDTVIMKDPANLPVLKGVDLKQHFLENHGIKPVFADMMISRMHYELNSYPELAGGNVLLVHLGRGIGMAMSCNGEIVMSRNRHGGELGHNICEPDGLLCPCGRRGCLETKCSTRAILNAARSAYKIPEITIMELKRKYESGSPEAERIVEEAMRHLSIALANQANNCFPDALILTGSLLSLGDKFQRRLEKSVRELLFEDTNSPMSFLYRDSSEHDATGAALMVVDKLLSSPEEFNRLCPKIRK